MAGPSCPAPRRSCGGARLGPLLGRAAKRQALARLESREEDHRQLATGSRSTVRTRRHRGGVEGRVMIPGARAARRQSSQELLVTPPPRRSSLFGPLMWWELVGSPAAATPREPACCCSMPCSSGLSDSPSSTRSATRPLDALRLLRGPSEPLTLNQTSEFAQALALILFETQLILVAVITPAYAASSISEEKDRQTLPLLLTTQLTAREIVGQGSGPGTVHFVRGAGRRAGADAHSLSGWWISSLSPPVTH